MTEKYHLSKRELVQADSNSTKPCKTGCSCSHKKQSEHILCVNPRGVWFIRLPRLYYGDEKFFEIALYAFCPNCGGFEYACVPTPQSDSGDTNHFVYVVNDKNCPILVTRSRTEAILAYTKLLKTFNNPFGATAQSEASINMVKFNE